MLEIDVQYNEAEVESKLNDLKVRTAMLRAVKQTMMELSDASTKEAPRVTGNLRRSHSYHVRADSNNIEGQLKNSANYWMYVNFGTSRIPAYEFLQSAIRDVEPSARCAQLLHEFYKP